MTPAPTHKGKNSIVNARWVISDLMIHPTLIAIKEIAPKKVKSTRLKNGLLTKSRHFSLLFTVFKLDIVPILANKKTTINCHMSNLKAMWEEPLKSSMPNTVKLEMKNPAITHNLNVKNLFFINI